MYFKYLKFALLGVALGIILSNITQVMATEPEAPPLRDIPGITADDIFPAGCVSCHLNFADRNMDTRISTAMANWTEKVEPKLLKKAQAASPIEVTLAGRHPAAADSLADIPKACIACHNSMPQNAPVFSQLVHLIHLTGGKDNHYMTIFKGECTHCHKFKPDTGNWFMPSGGEK